MDVDGHTVLRKEIRRCIDAIGTTLKSTPMDSETVAQLQEKLRAREEHIRETWVRAMEVKIVRDELNKCQRMEGVNHYENCKYLADKYLTMLRENGVKGYKHIDV